MDWNLLFFLNSALLGVGLAMDAFSVSCANGLNEPKMGPLRMSGIAGTYAFFQFAMPMIGWFCVRMIAETFASFQRFIPWIALVLLLYIGGKMLLDGLATRKLEKARAACPLMRHPTLAALYAERPEKRLSFGVLIVQGIATSIDALSVGFTIAEYETAAAFVASLVIAVVTFAICIGGLTIGKTVGTKLESKASILGGCILIAIGVEIWLKGIL
ncbi:MAG: manganese efflux pump [Firmicutes bacterium]|nr:manganese efflux pump [Bacillota bacterium]